MKLKLKWLVKEGTKWIKLESGAYASSKDLVGERLIQITPVGELKEYESFDEVNLDNKEEESAYLANAKTVGHFDLFENLDYEKTLLFL